MSFLVIPESTREDSGKYSLHLSNSAGEKAVFVRVKVLGEKQKNHFQDFYLKPTNLLLFFLSDESS